MNPGSTRELTLIPKSANKTQLKNIQPPPAGDFEERTHLFIHFDVFI